MILAAGKNVDVDVTVVIVSYNTAHLLNRLFAALEAAKAGLTIQVIVVDNASRDGSVEILRSQFPGVELIENSINVGFARANNQTLPFVRGRYLLLLNTDAIVSSNTLQTTVEFMEFPSPLWSTRGQACRAGWLAATVLPLFSDTLERLPGQDRVEPIFSGHSLGR